MIIRTEQSDDEAAIGQMIRDAFVRAEHSSGTEASIVDSLREADALTISLVATRHDRIIGHVAVSPVSVGNASGWFGLGPVAVDPDHQRQGVGRALIEEALRRLRSLGAAGCVVLGDPDYYARFGFAHDPNLTYRDVPPRYFQALHFAGRRPAAAVEYHPAFDGTT